MSTIVDMDSKTAFSRLADQIRSIRLQRGLTQAQLAERAHVSRLTVIAIEKGSPSVSASSYVEVACALGAEINLVPARMPTLEEVKKLFADE